MGVKDNFVHDVCILFMLVCVCALCCMFYCCLLVVRAVLVLCKLCCHTVGGRCIYSTSLDLYLSLPSPDLPVFPKATV